MGPRKIKVLIVDDSVLFREMLIRNLGADQNLEIIGHAVDSFDAFEKIKVLNPDVVTLDVEMPKMNGIDFLKKLMPEHPLPVVVVSSLPINALDALDAGAVDFVKKPQVKGPGDLNDFIRELIAKVKIASIARIGRPKPRMAEPRPVESPAASPAPRRPETAQTSAVAAANAAASSAARMQQTLSQTQSQSQYQTQSQSQSEPQAQGTAPIKKADVQVIAIGASTGGTDAILEVVRDLPATSPGVVIVQHMPAGFTKMYAQRLDKTCRMSVKEAEDGDRVETGKIVLAAGEYQMRLVKDSRGYYVTSRQGPKVSGHCPSVDVLFDSVADVAAGGKSIGVILTGMGSDGAKGLLKMKQNGSYTIGQDKETCVVYGMPMVSFNIGGVNKQLPLERITDEIVRYCAAPVKK